MPTIYTSLLAKHKSFAPSRRDRQGLKNIIQPEETTAGVTDAKISSLVRGLQQIDGLRDTAVPAARGVLALSTTAAAEAKRKVAIIGGGLAGLCAAFELKEAGYEVSVFEARNRVGGRTKTVKGVADNKSLDGGAELIGDNHPLWLYYADRFGLKLSDARDYGNSPVVVDGRLLSAPESEQLTNHLDKLIRKLTQAAESVIDPFEPWINPDAKELDETSLDQWLTKVKGNDDAKTALRKMLEADGGVTAKQQSLLGVLAMVRGGGLDRYWTDSELHRCEGGSQSLANAFEQQLSTGGATLHKQTQVCGLNIGDSGAKLVFKKLATPKDGGDPEPLKVLPTDTDEIQADFVVLAIPPSAWSTIPDITNSDLKRLLDPSDSPQMGKNVKNLMAFERRFWHDSALGPALTADAEVDMTWETTEADREDQPQFGLVAFSGAEEAHKLSLMTSEDRTAIYAKCLGGVYRHYRTELVKHEFQNWPDANWTKASYCFPAPGEVTKWGPIYKAGFMNRLHFAGEHTCYAYMGYMEGALSSGYRVAARIAVRNQLGIR